MAVGTQTLHPSTLNGGIPWNQWPDQKELLQELGLNAAQLNSHVTRGHVTRWKCPDLEIRFNPEEVTHLRSRLAQQEELTQADLRDANTEIKDVLKRACDLLKQAHEHNAKLFELVTKPRDEGMAFLINMSNHMTERLHVLEAANEDVVQKREELLSLSHDRELATMRYAQGAERWKEGLELLTKAVGPIVTTIAGNMGLNVEPHPAVELITSLDPKLVEMLEGLDILTSRQVELLRKIVPKTGAAAATPTPAPVPAPSPPPSSATPPAAPPEPETNFSADISPDSRPPRRRRKKPTK